MSVRSSAAVVGDEAAPLPHPLPFSGTNLHRRGSSGGWLKPAGPVVSISVSAGGSGHWTTQSVTISQQDGPDCTVEVETKQADKVPTARKRGLVKRLVIAFSVLSAMAAVVLVTIALTIGFPKPRISELKLLPPPAVTFKLIVAFSPPHVLRPSAADALPAALAAQVSSWRPLRSSGLHVATLNTRAALQQALATLAATPDVAYALTDFALVPDRHVTQVIDPDLLFEMARAPAAAAAASRQLLEGQAQQPTQQQPHSSSSSSSSSHTSSRAGLARLAQRKARRRQLQAQEQSGLLSAQLPATARHQQHQQLHGKVAGREVLEPVSPDSRDCWGATAGSLISGAGLAPSPVPDSHCQQGGTAATCGGAGAGGDACSSSSSSSSHQSKQAAGSCKNDSGTTGTKRGTAAAAEAARGHAEQPMLREQARRLQQLKPPVPPPELQQQQKPAQRHVQRGGTSVAWYLGEGGLKAARAWNTSFGSDTVVVAVVDSGVEVAHGAVGASVWVNAGEVAGDGIDNDGNGFIDDVMGWDFGGSCADVSCSSCSPGPDPTDLVGWGSHAAGVVAGQPEVASGTAGLAPGVRVMPLKVADCRAGMQLSEVVRSEVQGSIRQRGSWSGARAAPVMWGSAAVAAFDYAALNGAHIVLAAWQAGQPLDAGGNLTSTNSTGVSCVVGPGAAAAVAGLPASGSVGGPGSKACAAVQQQLFRQVLAPLQAAGVLLVTSLAEGLTEGSSDSGSGSTAAADVAAVTSLPCSLACELDTVLCVGLSQTATGVDSLNDSQPPASGAADYFSVLLGTAAGPAGASAATSAASSNSSGSSNSSSSSGSNTTRAGPGSPAPVNPPLPKKWSNPSSSSSSRKPEAGAGSTANSRTTASGCSSRSAGAPAVQLRAPGGGIRASWAWGSHAIVSGSSAAAAVAAGAAALAWSSLGAAVGAEASAGAFEGLGAAVRALLLGGGAAGGGEGAHELDLLQAVQSAAGYSGSLLLLPSQLPATSSVATPCSLTYTWHTLRFSGSPFDTSSMFLVARKALVAPALDGNADSTGTASGAAASAGGGFLGCSGSPFPIQDWELIGPTALVEIEAFVGVVLPGAYRLAVTCRDKFLLWLQDKWVVMSQQPQAGDGGGGSWQADVEFAAAGYYKLRVIIYQPVQAPFDLQWRAPGAAGFSPITSLVSLGRQQPLPAQLQQRLMLAMATGSSVRASKQAQQQQQQVNDRSLRGEGQQEADEAAAHGGSSAFATSASSGSGSRLRRLLSDWGFFFPFPFPFMGPGSSSFWGGSNAFVPRVSSSSRSSGAGGMPDYADGFSSLFGFPDAAGIFAPTPDDSQQPFAAGGSSFTSGSNGGGSSSSRDGTGPASAGSKHTPVVTAIASDQTNGDTHSSSIGAAGALPAHTSAARSGSSTHKQSTPLSSSSSSHRASGGPADLLPGAFAVAASFLPPQTARVFTPSLAGLQYSHTGVLPGPGLDVAAGQLQQALLGLEDATDGRAGFGVIQGWAHWQQLNAAAAAWLTALGQSGVNPDGAGSSSGVAGAGGASGEAARQQQLLQVASRVALASAGVQFRLSCRTCSLHVDGVAVAGGLALRDSSGFTPPTATQLSGCVLPARRLVPAAAGAGLLPALPGSQQLLHLAVLFSVDTVADATFRLESRPCSVAAANSSSSSSSSSSGGGGAGNEGFVLVEAAGAGASALGLSAAAAATATAAGSSGPSPGSSSRGYIRGMICSVTATLEPGEAEASGLGSAAAAGASSSRLLQRTVRLDASRLQQLADAAAASGAAAAALAASAGGNGSSSNSSSNSSSANVTEVELTARAVQGARGISVAALVPDWVADLPASTLYGFSCGCFWNGSWFGNVSAGLRPGSSGSAALYLAGWPVGLGPGQQGLLQLMYGPSDVAISSYSSWQQQRQLAAGSSSADPLGWESAGGGAAAGAAAGWGYRLSRHGGDAGQFDLGEVNGAAVRGVPEPLIGLDGSVGGGGRMHQLLVMQGEGLPGHGEVVLLAATQPPPPPPLVEEPEYSLDEASSGGGGDGAGEEGGGAEEAASRPLVPVVQGWLPGPWEAWVPAEPAAAVPAT